MPSTKPPSGRAARRTTRTAGALSTPVTPPNPVLEGLNTAQREAVLHQNQPLLIIAGAGTGKTTVITRRIAHLIAGKFARPEEILALTFTEKAAKEMEERVDVLVPYGYTDIWISTFHAFGDRVLREQALASGLSANFRVLSGPEQIAFLRRRLFELPLHHFRPANDPARYLGSLVTLFSRAKDEDVVPADYLAYAEARQHETSAHPEDRTFAEQAALQLELARTYAAYEDALRKEDAADFGDQVLQALLLFRRHPMILDQYRQRFKYILVDEFQDTNYAQFQLVRALCPAGETTGRPATRAQLTIVADDDQSIYKFRGAAISNILQFLETYPGARQVVLTENFRSTQPILDCAYQLVRQNDPDRLEVKNRIDKRLLAQRREAGHEPEHHAFDTVSSEADWVARAIQTHVEAGAWRYRDCAILVRSNRDADIFLRALNVAGIPWWFTGTTGLYAREEIRLCLAFLRAVADPLDAQSLYALAASELYRVPMTDLAACLSVARHQNRPLAHVLRHPEAYPDLSAPLSPEAASAVDRLLADLDRYVESSRAQSPGQLLYRFLSESGYLKRLAQAQRQSDVEQLQNIALFFERLQRFERVEHGDRLPGFLEQFELLRESGENPAVAEADPNVDAVNVLTVHKAKGLEFPVVFLVGLVQGRFPVPARRDALELPEPLIKDILPGGDFHLQEERRLFYVGLTRARDRLYLTSAQDYGGKTVRKVSQFVLEALNLPKPTAPVQRAAALEMIRRSSPPSEGGTSASPWVPPKQTRKLDPHGIDDYLTCPLKYKFSHLLRIPVMRHHLVVYGSALHKAIEIYLVNKQQGRRTTLEELWKAFESAWSSEGFLTREHEELRLVEGREALAAFHAREERSPIIPTHVEERFSFPFGRYTIVGRWDRVDERGDEVVIIDYKSSDVREQAEADRRARQSTQLGLYAMSWQQLRGTIPDRVELHFLESQVVGSAQPTAAGLSALSEKIERVINGLEANDFHAEPQEHHCRWCAYQGICPSAYGQR